MEFIIIHLKKVNLYNWWDDCRKSRREGGGKRKGGKGGWRREEGKRVRKIKGRGVKKIG